MTTKRERLALKRIGGEYAVLTHIVKQQRQYVFVVCTYEPSLSSYISTFQKISLISNIVYPEIELN